MGILKRVLAYGAMGAAKESAKRAWESESYIESAILAAQTGVLGETAKNLLEGEFEREEEPEG